MAKISVIGICGNSVFMNVDHFHAPGETLAAIDSFEEMGGKGINQAVAAARMGARVSFLAAVGQDENARRCRKFVAAEGIRGFFAEKIGLPTAFAFILTDRQGENRVTVCRGAQLEPRDVSEFEDEIRTSDILLLQQEVPTEVNRAAIEMAEKYNVPVILNPAPPRDIPHDLAEKIFLVTPNEQERQEMGNHCFQNCVTTLGKNGCSINDETLIKALPVEAVDTTGAGDTFNGVLAVCLAEGMDVATACEYAVAASGLSVTKRGVMASIPTRKEIEKAKAER